MSSTKLTSDALVRRLQDLFCRERLSLDIVSGRASRVFSRRMGEALPRYLRPRGIDVTLRELRDARVPSDADIVLLQCHVCREEPAYLTALRDSGYAGVIVGWFWDNHHVKDANRRVGTLVDAAIAAHDCHAAYLAETSMLLRSVMLCVAQWTADEAAAYWASLARPAGRRSDLYGGFSHYKGSARSVYLEQLIATEQYPALRFVNSGERPGPGYFELTSEARFREWARYAVSLCLPYRNDLSSRFFDAWLTGQITVVTPDIAELSSTWAVEHRDRDFVCASSYERADVDDAHRRALDLFKTGGVEGQNERHELVLSRHLFHHRIELIVDLLRQAAEYGLERVMHAQASCP